MKMHRLVFLPVTLACAALAGACSSDTAKPSGVDSGTGAGGAAASVTGVSLTPSPMGFVAADSNSLGAVGAWYAYGDGYDMGVPPGKCQGNGHPDSECSKITSPAPGSVGFPPNASGAICTAGTVAAVTPIPGMAALDYSNIYGAGIGLDLNNAGGANSVKAAFPATMKGVKGVAFDIDTPPLAFRVEFPATDTDSASAGSDYWKASPTYPPSPVKAGTNVVPWSEIGSPQMPPGHVFNPDLLESIQFHVPASGSPTPYAFCISNVKLLM